MMMSPETTSPRPRAGYIVLLASLPLVVKIAVGMLGLVGYFWQSSYKLLQLTIPVLWRRNVRHRRGLACWWPIDDPPPTLDTWALAVTFAMTLAGSAIAAILLLAPRLGIDPTQLRADMDARFSLTPLFAALIVVYLFTINAALEELHFRAWLDRELSARWGNLPGILFSAMAFATMHIFIFAGLRGANPTVLALVFLALSIAGAAWSILARRPGGIHAAWLSHGLTDAGLLTWGLFWLDYF